MADQDAAWAKAHPTLAGRMVGTAHPTIDFADVALGRGQDGRDTGTSWRRPLNI